MYPTNHTHFLEVITKLDDGCGFKHPVLVNHELAMLQRIDIALYQQEVGTTFDWQEAFSGDVDTVSIFEVLDRSTRSSFKLCAS